MARRSFARILAPLALVGALVAIVLVVQSSLSDPDGATSTPTSTTGTSGTGSATTGATDAKDEKPKRKRRAYTVKPGDILTTVSEKTGVSVEELEELNPDVDPQALQVGQRLKLPPAAASTTGTDEDQ